ncbi:hypothetical protein [Halalkalirubrum salinum]|uniref:hypothetical protein n=1 Tax=Halalkalirubrum salinum TaxID=2563889 RepID=UPI0010FB9BC0|nr:hypothetical protein [Halalkalirubrum salinum]
MRRIYESNALDRDDADPFKPNASRDTTPTAARSIPAQKLSAAIIPQRLIRRGVTIEVSTPRSTYTKGQAVPFHVQIRNRLPIPITIETKHPVLWTWSVDGHRDASRLDDPLPARPGQFTFDRGETKRFTRRWTQTFRVSSTTWEEASPGIYTIRAAVAVDDAVLSDSVSVTIE